MDSILLLVEVVVAKDSGAAVKGRGTRLEVHHDRVLA